MIFATSFKFLKYRGQQRHYPHSLTLDLKHNQNLPLPVIAAVPQAHIADVCFGLGPSQSPQGAQAAGRLTEEVRMSLAKRCGCKGGQQAPAFLPAHSGPVGLLLPHALCSHRAETMPSSSLYSQGNKDLPQCLRQRCCSSACFLNYGMKAHQIAHEPSFCAHSLRPPFRDVCSYRILRTVSMENPNFLEDYGKGRL